MVFTRTCECSRKLAIILRNLGLDAIPINGQMSQVASLLRWVIIVIITIKSQLIIFLSLFQPKRLGALNKFKAGERSILICTDVASRGLDIPAVDVVINYDIPMNSKVSYFLCEKGSLFFLHQEVLYFVHVIAHA